MSVVEAIIRDLAVVVDQARWAHAHGYQKEGRGLDAARGVDLSRTEAERFAGPTYDLEIGSHTSRVAYQHAVTTVVRADHLVASMLTEQGVTFQPRLTPIDPHMRPDQLVRVAARLARRVGMLTTNPQRLSRVRSALDRSVRSLSKALDQGPADGIAHRETPCKTCRIRPQAEREKPDGTTRAAKAGECDVCAQYRWRNGSTRPTTLDSGPVNEARAAQARRHARGEGWGVG